MDKEIIRKYQEKLKEKDLNLTLPETKSLIESFEEVLFETLSEGGQAWFYNIGVLSSTPRQMRLNPKDLQSKKVTRFVVNFRASKTLKSVLNGTFKSD